MRYQLLLGGVVAAGLSLAAPSPASAQSSSFAHQVAKSNAHKWELRYLALSAIDAAQTMECIGSGECEEVNPLFGKHPKARTIIAAKLIGGAAHYALFRYVNERNPKAAMRLAQGSLAIQGTVVMLNARFAFK